MKLIDYIIKKGFDREMAQKLIKNGQITLNKIQTFDQKTLIDDHDIVVIQPSKQWVSRGAYKLIKAIEHFDLNFNNKVVLDIGSSTGGFTDVSLKYGAKKVYALDVGVNQLNYQLRINPRVVVYEKTNLKSINSIMFKEKIDFVLCDVSFISLSSVFKVLHHIKHQGLKVIVLVKPQFEANKNQVQPRGYLDIKYHPQIINKVNKIAKEHDFKIIGTIESPIKGLKSKNIEYISYYEI